MPGTSSILSSYFTAMIKYSSILSFLLLFTFCSKPNSTSTILILAQKGDFGLYTGEILKTEGFNHFILDSTTDAVTLDYLAGFDVVILARAEMSEQLTTALTEYVHEGGNLISFRPEKEIHMLFGIKDVTASIHSGYIAISDDNEIGSGLITQRLQFHGDGDRYVLNSGKEIAKLIESSDASASPAVVINAYGKGYALAFAYNLPESIVYTRQGNPANAGLETDGILGIRAMDLFTGGWVDTTKNTLNQADEQMRLLTRGIEYMSSFSKPFPRLWYFPDSLNCVVTLNNDGEDSREDEFLKQFDDVELHGARMTLYIKEPSLISRERIAAWTEDGFEMSGHPDDTKQAVKPDWSTMDSVYTTLQKRLQESFGISSMRTITNHWFVWVGNDADGQKNFAAQAKLEEKHGVRLDCNYAHYDNGSNQGHFLGPMGLNQGNYTGSGLTMKFANGDGGILNIYQQLNNVYDQQYMEHKDQEGYFNAFKGIMDRSLHNEVYSSISVRAHNNEYFFSELPLMKMLEYAKSNNVPVWTELSWLQFLETKDEATFQNIVWADNKLTFDIHSAISYDRDLTCLIPYRFDNKIVAAIHAGENSDNDVITIKGKEYARVFFKAGVNTHFEVFYGE